jgi:hypothetical protein
LFGPVGLFVIFSLGFLAANPRLRFGVVLCAALSALITFMAVETVPSYSFWTQAGLYGFVFTAASVVGLPLMLVVPRLFRGRSPPPTGGT